MITMMMMMKTRTVMSAMMIIGTVRSKDAMAAKTLLKK